jgi:D-beta-D-heptose 7-phosphate kinase/D-beta-D-heptose 1-phosphate adenosyltransferase
VRPLLVVGDLLLDRDLEGTVERVAPDAPVPVVREPEEHLRPGGAGLAALLAARRGRKVTLLTAVGRGEAGAAARGALEAAGVAVLDLGLDGPTPEKIRVKGGGQVLVRVDRGDEPSPVGAATGAARELIAGAAAVLVADYGRGVAAEPGLRGALAALPAEVPLVWDPHPKGPDPVPGALVVTPNRAEARSLVPEVAGDGPAATAQRARVLAERWTAVNVCVTLGADGALVVGGTGAPLAVPVERAERGDPCGAGDAFAAALAGALADGALPSEGVRRACAAAAAWVAGPHDAAAPEAPAPVAGEEAFALAARVRAQGGTVVATGGCFDLVHAGHVRVLEQARALGDCLVVCLNSDASVRRLKGPDRPVVGEEDRVALLRSLACVDAVAVFGEDTPEAVLAELRPELWVKGGDYRVSDLPEAKLLESWGGQAVVLPYVPGRSTTSIIERVRA